MQVDSAYATWVNKKPSTHNWDVSFQKGKVRKIISKINNKALKIQI